MSESTWLSGATASIVVLRSAVPTPRVACRAPLIVAALFGSSAYAQQSGDGAAPAEVVDTPNVLVLGFVDTSPADCDPRVARYGRCIEDVRFMDMRPAWDATLEPDQLQRVEWMNTSTLYAEMWEDIAHRWSASSDPIGAELVAKGISRLPPTRQQWQGTARDPAEVDRSVYALPRASSWLGASRWIDQRAWQDHGALSQQELTAPTDAIFPALRFGAPKGLMPNDAYVILKGRFALRLAADNRLHPYDMMDADPASSAPLFEQMYPYQRAYAEDDEAMSTEAGRTQIPLSIFRVPDDLHVAAANINDQSALRESVYAATLVGERGSYEKLEGFADGQFETFYDLVGTQILRFAREEYTPTHLRVLTALMAMEAPPSSAGDGYVASDAVVAAAPGQMDTVDPTKTEFRGFAASRDGFAINTVALPTELVERHIQQMEEWRDPSQEFLTELFISLVEELRDHLSDSIINQFDANPVLRGRRGAAVDRGQVRPWVNDQMDRYRLRGTDPASISTWIAANSFEGRAQIVTRLFKRVALDLLLERKNPIDRERIETRILLDHLNFEIKRSFGGDGAPVSTPGDVEERAKARWSSVLGSHGIYPEPIQDRPGVVNPLAICTVTDRLKALTEPSFGPISVDELVVAPASLTSVEELLWDARERLPFIQIDDPEKNLPTVTRLAELPGDRAVYRVRWRLWSGWHMLWGVERLGPGSDAPRRMALRTGALCADTVIADPQLVPVLLRAALLDGEFRPAIPVYDAGKTKRPKKDTDNDKVKTSTDEVIDAVDDERSTAITVIEAGQGSADAQVEIARSLIQGMSSLGTVGRKRDAGLNTTRIRSESVQYVRDLFLPKLQELGATRSTVAMVFDHGKPSGREPVWTYKPRTPYAQTQTRFVLDQPANLKRSERVRYLRTAGWTDVLQPLGANVPVVNVSPAYAQTELLTTAELRQEWSRRKTSDWYFGGGLGFIPYKRVQYQCSEAVAEKIESWAGVVENCILNGVPTVRASETQGIHLDLAAMNTQWLVQDRRFGIEFGPEVQIDVLQRGASVFTGDNPYYGIVKRDEKGEDIGQPIQRPWAVRFQAGIVVGVHFAPDPFALWRANARRFPWGAPLPDGSSSLGRFEWGLRAGLLLGPTGDGLEGTAIAEWWGGWSIRFAEGKQASFTPYHPNILIGPYVRGQVGFPIAADKQNYLLLQHSGSLSVGIRAQFRLATQPEFKPEVPE